MANNRMYLVFRPTGKAVCLGKRYVEGWFAVPDDIREQLERLFEDSEFAADYDKNESNDDFAIAMEVRDERTPYVMELPNNLDTELEPNEDKSEI